MPTTVAVPDPEQPAPNPAPPTTAAEPDPFERAGVDYPTAEDDPAVPDPKPQLTSAPLASEPAEITDPTGYNRGADDQDGDQRPSD